MKNLILFISLVLSTISYAGGGGGCTTVPNSIPSGCSNAEPFCTGTIYEFNNTVNTGDAGELGCLLTTPNPTWFYLRIDVSGDIDISISQTNTNGNPIDVDFALLGPYPDLGSACSNPSGPGACIEDCSFSIAATETANITGGNVGEYYLLLLTNFSNQAGIITFSQTGGSGATDCSVLNPQCLITSLTSTPTQCINGIFNLNGQIIFENPPQTGTLTISSSCGQSQVLQGPFQSPINYSFNNLTADGSQCIITTSFSDSDCSLQTTYTAPLFTTPTFNLPTSFCLNSTPPTLPNTSDNGIVGSWQPNNIITNQIGNFIYTFTPNDQCSEVVTISINITELIIPTFTQVGPFCQNDIPTQLPTTSLEGILGVWDSQVSTTIPGTFTHTFTPTGTGCNTNTTMVVLINDLPIADAGDDISICSGDFISLNGVGGSQQLWDNNVINNTPFQPQNTNLYTLTVTDNNGCQNSDNILITVNQFSIINGGPDLTICQGTEITLLGFGGTNYIWDNGVINGVPFTPTVGINTYNLLDQNPNGCPGSDQVIITVIENPTIDAGINTTICQDDSILLLASGGINYIWTNSIPNNSWVSPQTTTTYNVVGTNDFGCFSEDSITISVVSNYTPSFIPSTTTICLYDSITFVNTSPVNNFYTWMIGNTIYNEYGPITHQFNQTGCYDITLISTSTIGCVDSVSFENMVCVVELPISEFSFTPTTINLLNTDVNFINNSTGGVSYVWNFGDGNTSNLFSPTNTYPWDEPGSYITTLYAINEYGCVDTSYQIVKINNSIVYYVPNTFTPDNNEFNQIFKPIFSNPNDVIKFHMNIYNRWGEVVFETYNINVGWNGSYGSVDIVQSGTYVYILTWTDDKNNTHINNGHVNVIK